MTAENTLTLTQKIKADYRTIKLFCTKNGVNYNTFRKVVYSGGKSKPLVELLRKKQYIKNADELKKVA